MKKKITKLLKRKSKRLLNDQPDQAQAGGVPRITNETVAAHREEVLGSARKYIYPLQHSKHRIVIITTALILLAIVAFFTYTTLALYRFQSTSTFLYRATQVIPFPIARSGGQFIAYENYLFELRHYMHYYETQENLDFSDENGKQQLNEFKHRALEKVINDAYVKRLAEQHNVTVSDREVDEQIEIVRNQNRLGGSEQVFEDVLKDYWGWSVDDFKRSLRQQMLAQKVVAALDKDTWAKAEQALEEIKSGTDFAAAAAKYSEDEATKQAGGEFPFQVDRTNRELSAHTTRVLFELEPNEVSEVVNIGYALEILKTLEKTGDRVKGAHILFNFRNINEYINDLKAEQPVRRYVTLPEVSQLDVNAPPEPSE